MSRLHFLLFALVLLAVALPSRATAQDGATRDTSADATVNAIAQQMDRLQKAFNAGQIEALATHFLPTADLVDEKGVIHSGRDELVQLFSEFFEKFPGAQMELELHSVRVITPELATGDLVRTITSPKGNHRAISRSAMTYALHDGAWLIATGRDVPADAELSPHQQLEPLAWLIGDWVDEAAESLVKIRTRWSDDGNYILMNYEVTRGGEVQLSSEQRLGWDPLYEQVRSWAFDADGGFGNGLWTRVGDTWVFKSTAVLPDGATGSATFVIEPQGKDRILMRGLDRIIGDEIQPDVEMTIVRQPPRAD
jgi:uncharacterized protein (TIGR02246 family)